jgi:uncharacterized protein
MPVQVSYPGVYVEEISSGVRTITGVATSIAAFIGRAQRGPVDKAITINSYGDFERIFGGLWPASKLGFAVRDFYLNGGNQAVIVRLFHPTFATEADRQSAFDQAKTEAETAADAVAMAASDAAAVATPAPTPQSVAAAATGAVANAVNAAAGDAAPITRASLSVNGLELEAASEGAWGNALRARIDHEVKGDDAANLFNLSVRDNKTGVLEIFRNVSVVKDHPRQVDKVLTNESALVRLRGALPNTRPTAHSPNPEAKKGIWDDNTPATNTKVGNDQGASDGKEIVADDFNGTGKVAAKKGLYSLEQTDLFNLLCIPPHKADDIDPALMPDLIVYCEKRRAMLLIDPPSTWSNKDQARDGIEAEVGDSSKNAAVFFPRLRQPNPLHDNQFENFVPCGAVAGVFARTDAQRGVWKAPAGLEATLVGVPQLSVPLTDLENGELNQKGINCLRTLPAAGRIVWGSRTRVGDDRLASEWKYVPVRRTALFLEESLYRGLQWVVFEPNDEPLWAQIRLNVGAFLHNLFRQGAFQGKTPRDAYFVKCDKETTTQNDINLGIVNIIVGFAPLKPAEFVIIKLQQMAGQIEV